MWDRPTALRSGVPATTVLIVKERFGLRLSVPDRSKEPRSATAADRFRFTSALIITVAQASGLRVGASRRLALLYR